MKKRIDYLDIARAIAIILVVMSHCDNSNGYISISKFAGLFFIPLFIFISGYFSKENKIYTLKDLFNHLKSKVLSLYLYYVKWEVIFLVLTNVFIKIGFYNTALSYGDKIIYSITSVGDLFKKVFEIILLMGREPFCGAFWFIISLILIMIMFSVINLLTNNIFKDRSDEYKLKIIGIIVIILFMVGCIMNRTVNIPRISPAITLLFFYYLGFICHKYSEKIKFDNTLIASISILLLCVLYNFGTNAMNSNNFPNGIFLLVSSLSGIYFSIYISKKIEVFHKISKIFIVIGKNTLPIVALHFISFKIVMLIQYLCNYITFDELGYLKGYNNYNLWYVLYIIVGISVPILISKLYKKFIVKEGD